MQWERQGRPGARVALAFAALVCAGCFAISETKLRDTGLRAAAAQAPVDAVGEPTNPGHIAHGMRVRFGLVDGTSSRWFDAGELRVGARGVSTEFTAPASEIKVARVRGLEPAQLATLWQTAPLGGTVTELAPGSYELAVEADEDLASWIAAFVVIASKQGKPAGQWLLQWTTDWLDAQTLVSASGEPRIGKWVIHEGLAWDQIATVEVSRFDGTGTAIVLVATTGVSALLLGAPAIFYAPLGAMAAMATVAGVLRGAQTFSESEWGSPELEASRFDGLLAAPEASLKLEDRPLLTPGRRRRAALSVLVGGDVVSARDLDTWRGGLQLGARLSGIFEGAFVLRWRPLPDGERKLVAGGRAGLHLPLDARQRFALMMGIELAGNGTIADIGFTASVRLNLGHRGFVGLKLLNPHWTSTQPEGLENRTTLDVLSGVELGALF